MADLPDWPRLKRKHRPRNRRVTAIIAYDGSAFSGFQRQPERRTVEGDIINALQDMGLSGGLGFASRTDSGVHAQGQVIAFMVPQTSTPAEVAAAFSARLPPRIRLRCLTWAPPKFHPRWSAIGKDYVYRVAPPDWDGGDKGRLRDGVAELLASPSLSGFTAAGGVDGPAPPLTRLSVEWSKQGAPVLHFEGPAFRRYAIRHMVGALLAQARGLSSEGNCAAIAASAPPYRGPRAAADGLTLMQVTFPDALNPFKNGPDLWTAPNEPHQ